MKTTPGPQSVLLVLEVCFKIEGKLPRVLYDYDFCHVIEFSNELRVFARQIGRLGQKLFHPLQVKNTFLQFHVPPPWPVESSLTRC